MRRSPKQRLLLTAGFISALLFGSRLTAAEPRYVLSVPASDTALHVAIRLPADFKPPAAQTWQLVEIGGAGMRVAAQIAPATVVVDAAVKSVRQVVVGIPPSINSTAFRRFSLEPINETQPREQPALRFQEVNEKSLGLWDGKQPVLVYNHGVITGTNVPTDEPRRRRGCYIHPLWGLNGEVLTDDFPKDHYHHHGLFWTWPHVGIDGTHYDLWLGGQLAQRFVRWTHRGEGPVAATLAVENGWFVGDKKVMTEHVSLRVFKATENARAIDVEFVWIPGEHAITLQEAGGKSYGGFTARFAPRTNTVITVPEGRTTEDLKIARLPWADFTGQFSGSSKPSGAALFVDRRHPDFPPTWLTRHYGALCIGWPGIDAKTFPSGKPIRASYRIWIHKTAVDKAGITQAYVAYTAATSAKWE